MKTKLFLLLIALSIISCAKKTNSSGNEENVDVTKIYNVIILDKSGSMDPLREVAVQGYNSTLDIVRKAQEKHNLEQQNLVTLVLFNDSYSTPIDCKQIQSVDGFLLENYQPCGWTAMLDAIGVNLTKLKEKLDSLDNASAVVTIISDGMENASIHYDLDSTATLIDQLKEMGVMIVFLGTNQNVEMVAAALHIDNFKYFEYSTEGMNSAWQQNMNASAHYYDRMQQYNKDTKGMSRTDRNAYYKKKTQEDGWFRDTLTTN